MADKPAQHGLGRGGYPPPVEYRWKPGQSGNPKGRPAAGAVVLEHINALTSCDAIEADLLKIVRSKKEPIARRMAAKRLLAAIEHSDLADFDSVLAGEVKLSELRDGGVDTSVVKRIKSKSRVNHDANGDPETVIEREIELHDRSAGGFDQVLDRTIGKPTQALNLEQKSDINITVSYVGDE